MNALGIELLIVSNAAGGLNPNFACGDVMVIDDHINLLNRNPLVGVNDDELGPRFPDMGAPYDRRLGDRRSGHRPQTRFRLPPRCLRRDAWPNYETRAEFRMLRYFDADVVGMSTVPEAIVAMHAGLRVLGLSTITNICCQINRSPPAATPSSPPPKPPATKLLAIVTEIIAGEFGSAKLKPKTR